MTIDQTPTATFSAFLLGNLGSVMAFPALKEPQSNNWAEYNGLEVDLSAPKLQKRSFEITFYLKDKKQYEPFTAFLTQKTYRQWHFSALQKSYTLRVEGFSALSQFLHTAQVTVKLSDDFPLKNYTHNPINAGYGTHNWFLNNVPFSAFGVYILQGTSHLLEKQALKSPLLQSNALMGGVQAFEQPLRFEATKVQLKCFLKAQATAFWQQYEALLYELSTGRGLTLSNEQGSCVGYYQNSSVQYFAKVGEQLLCEFKINIVII